MTTISLIGGSNNYILKNNSLDIIVFLLAGFLEAIGTILPGISSTALLMLMGVYSIFLKSLGNIYSFSNLKTNLYFLIPFSLGFIIGVIILVSLVNYLFKRYKSTSFSLILGISLSSIFALIINVLSKIKNIYMLIICIFFSILGYFITRKI
jgi:putative membrane protein